MIYDYNHYNDPKRGNKHIYAFGERYESIEYCGFIHADTKDRLKLYLTHITENGMIMAVYC